MVNYIYKGYVTKIVDGDTFDITIDLGFTITTKQRLRLLGSEIGINAYEKNSKNPEEKQLALAAMEFTKTKVLNKYVFIRTQKSDSFGRYLAEVFYIEEDQYFNLGNELLRNGLAIPYKR